VRAPLQLVSSQWPAISLRCFLYFFPSTPPAADAAATWKQCVIYRDQGPGINASVGCVPVRSARTHPSPHASHSRTYPPTIIGFPHGIPPPLDLMREGKPRRSRFVTGQDNDGSRGQDLSFIPTIYEYPYNHHFCESHYRSRSCSLIINDDELCSGNECII